jgi:hypothetical protein
MDVEQEIVFNNVALVLLEANLPEDSKTRETLLRVGNNRAKTQNRIYYANLVGLDSTAL